MAKTKPHSIRFEESEYDFINKREGLKTAQSIVDFLIGEYMKIYRVEKPSIFISKNDNPKESTTNFNQPIKENYFAPTQENKKRVLVRTYDQYVVLKRDCADADEWAALADEIRNSNLFEKEKATLLKAF